MVGVVQERPRNAISLTVRRSKGHGHLLTIKQGNNMTTENNNNNSLNEATTEEIVAAEEANVGEEDWMTEMEQRTEEMRRAATLWPLG